MTNVRIVNPLPVALKHYEASLRDMVDNPAMSARAIEPRIELGSGAGLRKLLYALVALLQIGRATFSTDTLVVLWPAFGVAELGLWGLVPRGRRLVVIHDPVPLHRQYGNGWAARRLGKWGSHRNHLEVVAHTELAKHELEAMGIEVQHVLPHPTFPPRPRAPVSGPITVTVLGQNKNARDLDLLEELPCAAEKSWSFAICGRGWPAVKGWAVTSRFLTEEELDDTLDKTHVLLLPYKTYFQSGIATRAFERGIPVVAARHEFIESLYGNDWPGLVDDFGVCSWLEAIERVASAQVDPDAAKRAGTIELWNAAISRCDKVD